MYRITTGISKFDDNDDYYPLCKIGEDGNGKCYCLVKEDNEKTQFFALRISCTDGGKILKSVQVPLSPKCFENGQEELGFWALMDYIPGMTLSDILNFSFNGLNLKKEFFLQIIILLANSLAKLHHQSYYHRDVKPDNIIIDCDMQPHLVDWGDAIKSNNINGLVTEDLHGTIVYMAPEAIEPGKKLVNDKSDVFSFGCTVMQMITKKFPFQDLYCNLDYVKSLKTQIAGDMRFNQNQEGLKVLLDALDQVEDLLIEYNDEEIDYEALQENIRRPNDTILKIIVPAGYLDDSYKTFHIDDPSEQYKNQLLSIVDQCLRFNMNERPSMDEVLSQILDILDENEKENYTTMISLMDDQIGDIYGSEENVRKSIEKGFWNQTINQINEFMQIDEMEVEYPISDEQYNRLISSGYFD